MMIDNTLFIIVSLILFLFYVVAKTSQNRRKMYEKETKKKNTEKTSVSDYELSESLIKLFEKFYVSGFNGEGSYNRSPGYRRWVFNYPNITCTLYSSGAIGIDDYYIREPDRSQYLKLSFLFDQLENHLKKQERDRYGDSGGSTMSETTRLIKDSIASLNSIIDRNLVRYYGSFEEFQGSSGHPVYRYTDNKNEVIYELEGRYFRIGGRTVKLTSGKLYMKISDIFYKLGNFKEPYQNYYGEGIKSDKYPKQYKRYQELIKNIRIREEQMSGQTGQEREQMKNELEVAKKKAREMEEKYGF